MTLESEIEELKKELYAEDDDNPWRSARLDEKIAHREALIEAAAKDDGKWTKHTDTYWSRDVNGKRLDFWPSTKKFRINDKTYWGLPYKLLEEAKTKERRYSYAEKYKAAEQWERSVVNQPEV